MRLSSTKHCSDQNPELNPLQTTLILNRLFQPWPFGDDGGVSTWEESEPLFFNTSHISINVLCSCSFPRTFLDCD